MVALEGLVGIHYFQSMTAMPDGTLTGSYTHFDTSNGAFEQHKVVCTVSSWQK